MKKSMSKRIIALVMGITVFGTGVLAYAADGVVGAEQTLTTDVDINNPTYSVIVPAGTDKIAIDALQMSGGSIVSADYGFINKSTVPVRVTISAKVAPDESEGLVFMDKADVNVTDLTNVDKQIYFAAQVPAAAESTDAAVLDTITYADTDTVVPLDESVTAMDFLLDRATYTTGETPAFDTLATGGAGVCAFKFVGTLNPNAAWGATDFAVQTTYKLQGVSTTAYAAVIADTDVKVAGAHQMINLTPAVVAPTPGFTNPEVSITGNVDAVNGLVLDSGYAISKVEIKYSDGLYYEIPTGQYTFASDTLTLVKDAEVTDFFIPSAYSTGYEIKVTATKVASADKTYTYTLKTAN